MLSFLLGEGALTVGVMSGVFTTALLNSFKFNIVEPIGEIIIPSNKLENSSENVDKKPLRVKIFLKDLIIWAIIMFLIYTLWKNVLAPLKPTK